MDELAHIPAGYGYVKYLDYRLNPEHPPLVKAIAALPLLFQKLKFPTDKSAWQKDVNGQWQSGAQFLYESTPGAGRPAIMLTKLFSGRAWPNASDHSFNIFYLYLGKRTDWSLVGIASDFSF